MASGARSPLELGCASSPIRRLASALDARPGVSLRCQLPSFRCARCARDAFDSICLAVHIVVMFEITVSTEFEAWYHALDAAAAEQVAAELNVLERLGPELDVVRASRLLLWFDGMAG